ncbi:Ras- protein Rab-5B, partial [Desmophyllum pertusum]
FSWFKRVPLDHDREMRLVVWDTHSEGIETLISYHRRAHVSIVVYDITNQRTFEKAKTWVKTLQETDQTKHFHRTCRE